MKHEFQAQYPFALKDGITQGFAIASLVRRKRRLPAHWKEIAQIDDDWARLEILSQAIVTGRKEEARMGTRKMSGGLRYWIERHGEAFLRRRAGYMNSLGIAPTFPDLSLFPPGAWAVQINFTLRKPYISRDDVDFYILDNPVKKEHVFKIPYVAPSQWKGALRAAMVRELVSEWQGQGVHDPEVFANRRFQMALLFGDEKGEEPAAIKGLAKYLDEIGGHEAAEKFREKIRKHFAISEDKPLPHFQGSLYFYPTFFDRIGLEVINPHDRKTGAGKQPIYYECVPAGTRGTFTLLYVPLNASVGEDENHKKVLKLVGKGLKAMLTRYGFGAKTSSGYGVADVKEEDIKVEPKELEEDFREGWGKNG